MASNEDKMQWGKFAALVLIFGMGLYIGIIQFVHKSREKTDWEFSQVSAVFPTNTPTGAFTLPADHDITIVGQISGGRGGDHHTAVGIAGIMIALISGIGIVMCLMKHFKKDDSSASK